LKKYCQITNDVETTSLWNHRLSEKTGEIVLKEGMPLLLEAYEKFKVKATFYFNGDIARIYPEVVKMVIPYGHEVASHGWIHESNQAFDVLSYDQQVDHLKRSKDLLENISQQEVISFRAPALRVNEHTPAALAATGFKTDSSVAPQRIDMFLSFGSKKKLKWLTAPRSPYYTRPDDLSKKGNGPIFEIPVSSFLLPYAGTVMRISPPIIRMVRTMLNLESKQTGRPLMFLIHPNELIDENIETTEITRRAKNYLAYLLGDKLRYHLKLRNLGTKALPLLVDQLNYLKQNDYEFVTIRNYFLNRTQRNEAVSTKS
jgi:peptidoglycan-N-acetylglucosamine deacetylase